MLENQDYYRTYLKDDISLAKRRNKMLFGSLQLKENKFSKYHGLIDNFEGDIMYYDIMYIMKLISWLLWNWLHNHYISLTYFHYLFYICDFQKQ